MIDFKKIDAHFRACEEKHAEEEMQMRANPNAYYTWEQKNGAWWWDDDWNGENMNHEIIRENRKTDNGHKMDYPETYIFTEEEAWQKNEALEYGKSKAGYEAWKKINWETGEDGADNNPVLQFSDDPLTASDMREVLSRTYEKTYKEVCDAIKDREWEIRKGEAPRGRDERCSISELKEELKHIEKRIKREKRLIKKKQKAEAIGNQIDLFDNLDRRAK